MNVDEIKKSITALYESDSTIHINLNRARKKLQNVAVTIRSVHSHFFIIEHDDGGYVAK